MRRKTSDLEAPPHTLSQAPTMIWTNTPPVVISKPTLERTMPIAFQYLDGRSFLTQVHLKADGKEESFLKQLLCWRDHLQDQHWSGWYFRFLTVQRIGISNIRHIIPIDSTFQCDCHQTCLDDAKPSLLLGDVIKNPGLLSSIHLLEPTTSDGSARHSNLTRALVVRMVLDKRKVAWLLITLLLLSPALGTMVGIISHQADAGIAVSAGIFALASFLQGLIAWLQG